MTRTTRTALLSGLAVVAVVGSWSIQDRPRVLLAAGTTCTSGQYMYGTAYPPNNCAQVQISQLGVGALPNGTTATTQTSTDNTTKIATDAFVQAVVSAPVSPIVLPNGTTATTQAVNDNTTKVSTDAFVQQQLAAAIALATGSTAVTQSAADVSTDVATDAFANRAAQNPQGAVTLPTGSVAVTQTVNDNTTKVATDAFVQTQIAAPASAVTLPNGSVATTQTTNDNTTKVATDAFALATAISQIAAGNPGSFSTLNNTTAAGSAINVNTETITGALTASGLGTAASGGPNVNIDGSGHIKQAPAPGALAATTVSPPTGTASATFVMAGIGTTCHFTPASSGVAIIEVEGQAVNNTGTDGGQFKLAFGTGTAPVNGAAATGTTSGNPQVFTGGVASQTLPFSTTRIISGLTVGTAVWFDLQFAAVTGGTFTASSLTCQAKELSS